MTEAYKIIVSSSPELSDPNLEPIHALLEAYEGRGCAVSLNGIDCIIRKLVVGDIMDESLIVFTRDGENEHTREIMLVSELRTFHVY